MLQDKVILVTGANQGIGFAIANLCQQNGAKVMLHGLDATQLASAATRIGPTVAYVAADLLDTGSPQKIIATVIDKFGRIDGLVNNAAMLNRSNIDSFDETLFDQMMAVNVRAPLKLIQLAVPHMKAQAAGSIVNIGSVNAPCGGENLLTYSTTKAALMTATRNLGFALARDLIRVNQLNVGWTATESEHRIQVSEGQPDDWHDRIPDSFKPTGRLMSPEQVAKHAAFWLSDQSAPVTGQVYEAEQYPFIGRSHVADWK
ncbi:MAG: SDR family oxidoreductase [Rhodobacteraceae bacterium]|nr:SDR family oxidoreductase [Paracoccaceae bacterium]